MAETRPTYEELAARNAVLEAEQRDAEWHLQRLAAIDDPLEKILVGIWEQIRVSGLADRWSVERVNEGQLERIRRTNLALDPVESAWREANTLTSVALDEQSLEGAAVVKTRPLAVADILSEDGAAYPETQRQAKAILEALGEVSRSRLGLPLRFAGERVGALSVMRVGVRPFKDEDIATIQRPGAGQVVPGAPRAPGG